MNSINKFQSLIILASVIFGLLLGQIDLLGVFAASFIVPFLIIMLFGIFLNIPMADLFKSFRNTNFFSANILINFIWTPLFAYFLGYFLLQNDLSIWIGFVMLMVTPCTDWYLIFTGIARGNLPLSTSVLPLNLVLQVFLLPVYLLLFFGQTGSVDSRVLIESIAYILLIPFIMAQLIKFVSRIISKSDFIKKRVSPFFEKSQVIFLGLAIMAIFASQGSYLTDNLRVVLILIIPLLLFFIVNFFLGRLLSKLLKFNYADSVSLNLTTLARNSPIALAIAVTAFPNDPLIALALVIGPLIELPVLALVSQVLLKMRREQIKKEKLV
ncbi:MAG: arsenic resistance protein [Chitinophagaceae bacterium]|nr:MAG: arsenic resistance protein [Chitinophagaceae bacterium]